MTNFVIDDPFCSWRRYTILFYTATCGKIFIDIHPHHPQWSSTVVLLHRLLWRHCCMGIFCIDNNNNNNNNLHHDAQHQPPLGIAINVGILEWLHHHHVWRVIHLAQPLHLVHYYTIIADSIWMHWMHLLAQKQTNNIAGIIGPDQNYWQSSCIVAFDKRTFCPVE